VCHWNSNELHRRIISSVEFWWSGTYFQIHCNTITRKKLVDQSSSGAFSSHQGPRQRTLGFSVLTRRQQHSGPASRNISPAIQQFSYEEIWGHGLTFWRTGRTSDKLRNVESLNNDYWKLNEKIKGNCYKFKLQTGAGSPGMRWKNSIFRDVSVHSGRSSDGQWHAEVHCGNEYCSRLRLSR